MSTATTTGPRTYPLIAKCGRGHAVRGEFNSLIGWQVYLVCSCGSRGVAKKLEATIVTERVCNGICMGATGPSCSCSCGGENHGANRVHVA